ncbi:MAG: efflux transporter periplasmic adaptor subunit [Caulobacter sp.]|nr:efflux transporter periplasmic adaptor subunit [Caulobacter sp.]
MTATPTPIRRRRPGLPRPALYAVGLVALIAVALGAWQLMKPKAPKDPYRTAAVEQGDITKSVSASGSLQALVTVTVGSQISGQITQVLVDFNDHVKRGQLMAVLDPQTYVSRVNQGNADIAAKTANLRQAEAQAAVAKANYNRTATLFKAGIMAKASLDADEAAWKAAQANVASVRAQITQSQATLASTQVDLGRTRIVAPIDGVVIDRQIEPGQTVAASLQAPVLFSLAQDLSKLQVKISVDEADIGQVREGQSVKFTVDAFPDDSFTGIVTQVRKQPETASNVVAYVVIAQADNPDGKLLPGMTANADIILDQRRGVTKVPVAALRWKPADQQAPARAGGGGGQAGQGGGGQGGGGQGGGGGRGGGGARFIEQLGLTPDQQKKAEPIMAEMRQKMMAAMGSDDPQGRRAIMSKARDEMLARLDPILSPEQRTKLVAIRAQMQQGGGRRGGMGSGVVWVVRDGKPTPIPVRVGATDGSYTEVTGAIKAGDQVIIGGGPKAKVQVRTPFGPGSGGGAAGGGGGGRRGGGPPGGM